MNLTSALNSWRNSALTPDITPETRQRLFFAIHAAISDLTETSQRNAMKYAGIPVNRDNVLRVRAMLGFLVGSMELDMDGKTISEAQPLDSSKHFT